MQDYLTYSANTYDEALDYLVANWGLFSDIVDRFIKLGKTDKAVEFARKYGYDIN